MLPHEVSFWQHLAFSLEILLALIDLNLLFTAFGKNFIKVTDSCQKIRILEYPVCF